MNLKPYTVVLDWHSDWFDKGADGLRTDAALEEAQLCHVMAASSTDALEKADEAMVQLYGVEVAEYLQVVVILNGYAYQAEE